MKREDILKVYEAGPDAVVNLVQGLIREFTAEIHELKERVKTLENQLIKIAAIPVNRHHRTDSRNRTWTILNRGGRETVEWMNKSIRMSFYDKERELLERKGTKETTSSIQVDS
ncbi:hypothetical protein JCM16163A_48590 [Paenibacillus sp. YK5]|uniref:Uncharacterized protein n=1 Tax=Paenibacillus naphthalenovorans TaxID=162209 RepID=A0A0U2WFE6_9BACL|nr:hypothetical protein IJ22_48240 [Paenibacillus naphthalenovorans]